MEFTGASTTFNEIFKSKILFTKHFLRLSEVIMAERIEHFLLVPREQSELGSTLFLSKTVEKVPCKLKLIEKVMSKIKWRVDDFC